MMAKAIIRGAYRACVFLIRRLIHIRRVPVPVVPTGMEADLSLEQLPEAHPELGGSSAESIVAGETLEGEPMEGAVLEDIEVGVEMDLVDREVELSEDTLGSDSDREDNEELVLAEDNRLEYWAWAHDWEDLDWEEDVWLEDETVSADLDEAVLPDELWE